MKRLLWSALFATLVGTLTFGQSGKYMGGAGNKGTDGISNAAYYKPEVGNLVGPWGQPVEMKMPYAANPTTGADVAKSMLQHSVPLDVASAMQRAGASGLQQTQYAPGGPGMGMPGPGMGMGGPGMGMPGPGMGMPSGMGMPGKMPPGMGMPGMGGPGMGGPGMGGPVSLNPGSMNPLQGLMPGSAQSGGPLGYPGAVAAVGSMQANQAGMGGPGGPGGFQAARTQVRFVEPTGMRIAWYAPGGDGRAFTTEYLEAPGRYNFIQAAIYRLKLTNLPNRTNLSALYPTLEVVPASAKTATFLAHSSVPIGFTEEDIEQVVAGNFLVKVIYLPDPQFQDLAATGPVAVVSTPLEPGVDPITEALRRGSILAIIRLGNNDLEAPNTPAMDAPPPGTQRAPTGPGGPAGPGGGAGMLGVPGGNPLQGLPTRPQQPVVIGNPGPSLVPNIAPPQGPNGRPYLAPSPIPGLPAGIQGSGPPPVIDPRTLPPTPPPVNPSKTTSAPTRTPTPGQTAPPPVASPIVPAGVGSR